MLNRNWDADQDEAPNAPTAKPRSWAELFPESKKRDDESLWRWMESIGRQPNPFVVSCLDGTGEPLKEQEYHPRDEELATLCFEMNRAALAENPGLLPEGTVQVCLSRNGRRIEFAAVVEIDDVEAA